MTDWNKVYADAEMTSAAQAHWNRKPADHWTIWSIKNRWLRVVVAWPIALVALVAVVVAGVIMIPVSAVTGAWRSLKQYYLAVVDLCREFKADGVGAAAWAALSGKDEPA